MVVTLQGVDLALKDLIQIDGSIEKFDYIQIFFILGHTVSDAQFQCLIDMRRIGLPAPIADQCGFTLEVAFKDHCAGILSPEGPLQRHTLFGQRNRTRRSADPGKRDLHRIS